jgi:4-alpha-glucanotransferase
VTEVPSLQEIGCPRETPFPDAARDALIRVLLCAGSDLTILPLQDVFGWRDRINTPASIGERNWTWRLPWPVEDLMTRPDSLERAGFLRRYAGACGRRGP